MQVKLDEENIKKSTSRPKVLRQIVDVVLYCTVQELW